VRARGDGNLWKERVGGLAPSCGSRRDQVCSIGKDAASRVSTENMIELKQSPAGTTFAVKVHPRAKKNAITGEVGDALKVALTAPPVDGKANDACIDFFAKLLKVPRSSVTIAAGQTSRNKVIRVAGLSEEEVRRRLAN
jgi:uncharacterized protein